MLGEFPPWPGRGPDKAEFIEIHMMNIHHPTQHIWNILRIIIKKDKK